MKTKLFPCLAAALLGSAAPGAGEVTAKIEAESVLVKPAVLQVNAPKSADWSLWTEDKNAKAWSGGATIRNRKVREKDVAPEEADQLEFAVPVKESGKYALFVETVRNCGFSVDGGKTFLNITGRKALIPSKRFAAGEKISVIAANCFATPGNPGTVYIDCFELRKLPPASLANGDFARADAKGGPEGWTFYKVKDSSVRVSGNAAEITSSGPGWSWLLINKNAIACAPFDRYIVTGKAKNCGKEKCTFQLQFVGMRGRKIVNHSVASKAWTLAPGEEKALSLEAVVPDQDLETVVFRIVGYPGKVQFSDFKLRELENAREAFTRGNFDFRDVSFWETKHASVLPAGGESLSVKAESAGKMWTLVNRTPLPAPAGKGLLLRFRGKAENNARIRGRVVGMADGKQNRMALNPANFAALSPGKEGVFESTAFLPVTDCDHVNVEIDGFGDVRLAGLAVEICSRPEGTPLAPRKVTGLPAPVPRKEGRGLIVRPLPDGRLYASWRLTSFDHPSIEFDVFAVAGGKRVKLDRAPLRRTTDLIIEKPVENAVYEVVPRDPRHGVSGRAAADAKPYREFKLSDPRAKIWSITPADLDGDGEYEYVVRAATDSTDPWHTAWKPSKKPFFLEAFARDGRRLWTYDLSFNVESGIWYTPFTVGDFDGDGKDEVALKGSDWSEGDWREQEGVNKGKVLAGPEYLLVLEGATGREIARAPWPDRERFFDGYMGDNYAARNQIALFRPDGKNECILALRGTYGLMTAEAWRLNKNKLEKLWSYSNKDLPRSWWGQGAHTTRVADLDGDGRDEIVLGAAVLDDDGSPLWTTGCGHPDYLYVADITKKNPGLEVLTIYETGGKHGGFTCADGRTGRVIWELKQPHRHIHCGYASDMDARFRGWESGGDDSVNGGHDGPRRSYHFSPDGELLGFGPEAPYNNYYNFVPRFAYYDADLRREVMEPVVRDHRGGDCGAELGGVFFAQFDSEGDWREEIVVRIPGGFRIYGTLLPAMDRRKCLMTDPVYRYSVYSNASGYAMTPSMSALLADHAVDLCLTVTAPDNLEITVSSPLDRAVSGRLELAPPPGVTLARNDWQIDLKPGEIATFSTKLENPKKTTAFIEGRLRLADGTLLAGRVPAASRKKDLVRFPRAEIHLEAENFTSQSGGALKIRTDKRGTHGKCFSHWDKRKHAVTWRFDVSRAGRFTLLLRSASAADTRRILILNGKKIGVLDIPGTGGNGESFVQWQFWNPAADGKPLTFDLKAGPNTLTLENADDKPLNLDCLLLRRR